jgi:phage terminase Nu1 subunit (DNA packaging protein)
MKYEVLDIETVAGLLGGISERQVRNYVALGMPSTKDGRTRTFNWPEVLEWYVEYRNTIDGGGRMGDPAEEEDDGDPGTATPKEDIYKATLRKTRADADLKELALSRQRGEVIAIADAKPRLDRMMGNLRSKLLSMAPKLASRIEGLKTRTEREAAIKDELETVCREISTGAVVDLPDETKAAEAEPNPTSTETVELEASAELPTNVQILASVLNAEAYS